MFRNAFELEGLESRRMMSVVPMAVNSGPMQNNGQAHLMSVSVQAKKASTTAVFDVQKFAGNFREKTSSQLFASTLKITVVKPSGAIRGKLTIPWLFTNIPVKGRVGTDGRFHLQFEADFASANGLKGYYNGKVSFDGKAVSGTMSYDWSGNPVGPGFKISYLRQIN